VIDGGESNPPRPSLIREGAISGHPPLRRGGVEGRDGGIYTCRCFIFDKEGDSNTLLDIKDIVITTTVWVSFLFFGITMQVDGVYLVKGRE